MIELTPFPVLVLPFANFILDTTFTLFRRLFRRVTSIELLVGIACGGLWVWGKEPQNRDVHGNRRTSKEPANLAG